MNIGIEVKMFGSTRLYDLILRQDALIIAYTFTVLLVE